MIKDLVIKQIRDLTWYSKNNFKIFIYYYYYYLNKRIKSLWMSVLIIKQVRLDMIFNTYTIEII